jgi:hypothetical protein
MAKVKLFDAEAELVAKFSELVADACSEQRWRTNPTHRPRWTLYHETAGWDLLLAHEGGAQIGIEAKLSLNPKVLVQALPGRWAEQSGPDFRAVLVPHDGLQHYTDELACHLGIVVIYVGAREGFNGKQVFHFRPDLPDPRGGPYQLQDWPNWLPAKRCELPDYVPDVTGGHAAPVALTDWKIRAIKLLILLDRRGYVTRQDMKVLGISHSRWTDNWNGFLARGEDGYVRCTRTPDLKAQHPTNWAQIEADYETWAKGIETAGRLNLGSAA